MSTINPYQVYQQNSVMTAAPHELTLMLYNGCLKFLRLGKKAIAEEQLKEKNVNLIKAQNIILEFRSTLDPEATISSELEQLYEYIYSLLMTANMQSDLAALEEAEGYVLELRDTWKQAMSQAKNG